MFDNKYDFIQQYRSLFTSEIGREFEDCSAKERYTMLAHLIANKANNVKSKSKKKTETTNQKNVYYFSMEFLIGKLLENYLMNFGVLDIVKEGLSDMDESLEHLCEQEVDPGLGNGGLGRLAACFIDSLASLGYSGHGNGIRYRYGLFQQKIENGCQVEYPDNWLSSEFPWETRKPENSVLIRFGGEVVHHEENGHYWYTWEGGEQIVAMPYDIPIVGYGGETVNTLRLWSAEPYEEKFNMDAFNRGDYSGAMKFRSDIEAITCVLYPNDSSDSGKELRLKQEYMFVAAGLNTIIKSYKKQYGNDWANFSSRVAIHTNDTHPSLCAPELLRILIDLEHLDYDTAWDITINSISYTNHTILPEALETWPIDMFRRLLPRVYNFIEEIDRRYLDSISKQNPNWSDIWHNTAILWAGQVRMANLSIIAGHAVNGVAELHTKILKEAVLHDFYTLQPDKFSNKTNGITHRRFLAQANQPFSKLITSTIGDKWMTDASELEKLDDYTSNDVFLKDLAKCKLINKQHLADYVMKTTGIVIDPNSIFDIQVKRFHAYKRQLLNLFKVMNIYNQLLEDPSLDITPTTFIFAGKAAQGYEFAKEVIRLVNSVADVINNDSRVNDRIRVAFIPNFSVSNAQVIYPAADISEQISTAGLEASGTGNMKFMMNGAITLGTLDGSTVEIAERVGANAIEIFGLRAEEIMSYKQNHSYIAWNEYNANQDLKIVVDQLVNNTFSKLSGNFNVIYDTLLRTNDEFFVLKDFDSYINSWNHLNHLYKDSIHWNRISLHNTAQSGYFSSDRTIKQYADEIWHL